MRECERHPSESQPSGGVCAGCLEERLSWLWRGESFRQDDPEKVLPASTSVAVSGEQLPGRSGSSQNPDARSLAESQEAAASLASVRKQLQVHGAARPIDARTRVGVSSDVVNGNNQRNGEGVSPVVVASLGDAAAEARVSDGDPGSGNSILHNSKDVIEECGNSTLHNSKDVIEEWTEFHARRRRNLELGLEGELDSPKAKSKSLDSIEPLEPNPSGGVTMETENVHRVSVAPNPELIILMNAQKMRSRSMPLDNRSAEDTALRVINEQADDPYFDEFDAYGTAEDVQERNGGGEALQDNLAAQRCFSPVWQSRKSPKWVKVLVSPMTSRNRVFPSRSKEDARKGRGSMKRGARFVSSDWSGKEAHGRMSPQWMGSSPAEEGMPVHTRTSMRSSVFSWLQDADTTQHKKYDQTEQLTSSSSSSLTNSVSTDSWLRDLTTVGHLHEIAEELEIVEESSEEEEEHDLGDMSSFGKFLLIAAQRQPKARLTRLVSATSN